MGWNWQSSYSPFWLEIPMYFQISMHFGWELLTSVTKSINQEWTWVLNRVWMWSVLTNDLKSVRSMVGNIWVPLACLHGAALRGEYLGFLRVVFYWQRWIGFWNLIWKIQRWCWQQNCLNRGVMPWSHDANSFQKGAAQYPVSKETVVGEL